jgi:hypothetical protein
MLTMSQCKSLEQLYVFTDKGKETFIKAAEVRQDEVYRRLIVEVSSITQKIQKVQSDLVVISFEHTNVLHVLDLLSGTSFIVFFFQQKT